MKGTWCVVAVSEIAFRMHSRNRNLFPLFVQIGNEVDNILAHSERPVMERVVELSIKLRGETYDDALRDQSSLLYQDLSGQFIKKVCHRLPEKDKYISIWKC